ncbi:MAG: O-succinylhomoserine sulfhydrylase [Nocardioides sp.]|nr:O-succinylhomoserine sulfhydrylase [Nocardioides sp.]
MSTPPGAWRPDTLAVRAGLDRTAYDETSEALFLTSGYVYPDAAEAERAFAGESEHYMYSRFTNPTVTALADRLRALEGAEACYPTATGMAAVFTALMALVRAGDRVVSARSLFGSCFNVVHDLLPRWGVEVDFVDGHDLAQWERALDRPARAVFFESPSNPMHEIVDVAAVADLAHAAGAVVVVDNAFASPALQRPLDLGADVVAYSATKHMDGQGRVLGGAILGSEEFVQGEVKMLMRNTGPSMSPFNAWVVLKGLETLRMRVAHASTNALDLAGWLEGQRGVSWVRYPHLDSHPQAALARAQMSAGGTVVTFEVEGGKERAFAVLDALQLVDISNNFGDAKSLVTHPATTTHHKMGAEGRAAIGVTDGVVRLSVGLEDIEDLREDLARALAG